MKVFCCSKEVSGAASEIFNFNERGERDNQQLGRPAPNRLYENCENEKLEKRDF